MSQEPTTPPPVQQRNTTGHPYNFAETKDRPAYTVLPGETTEHAVLLDGWTAIDEDEPTPSDDGADEAPAKSDNADEPSAGDEAAEAPAPKKATPSRRRAAAADTEKNEGGEPQ